MRERPGALGAHTALAAGPDAGALAAVAVLLHGRGTGCPCPKFWKERAWFLHAQLCVRIYGHFPVVCRPAGAGAWGQSSGF